MSVADPSPHPMLTASRSAPSARPSCKACSTPGTRRVPAAAGGVDHAPGLNEPTFAWLAQQSRPGE
jgi:hypothetical protein